MRYHISTVLMLLFCICQQLSSISYFSGIHLIYFCWLISTFVSYGIRARYILFTKKYIILYLFLAFYFMSMIAATNLTTGFARLVAMMEMLSPIYMYDLYQVNKWNGKKYPFYVLIIVLLANMMLSFSMINIMGDTGLRNTIQADSDNALKGAFSLIYSLSIIIPTIVYVLKSRKKIGAKSKSIVLVASILFGVYSFILVFRSYFITALITTIVGVLFALIYEKRRWLLKGGSIILVAISVFLASFTSLVSYIDNISYGASRQITPKLYELKYLLTGETTKAGDLSSRANLALSSLNTFLENPIVGVSYKAKDFEDTITIGVGNHSEWLDNLALYGLFSLLLFSFIYMASKQQLTQYGFSLSLLLFFFLGCNNPVLSFSMLCNVFLLIPMFFDIIKLSNKGNRNFNNRL